MQDFDANDDIRVPGAGQGGTPEPADRTELGGAAADRGGRPPIVRRARQPRVGHGGGRFAGGARRTGVPPLARRRRAARSACPRGGRPSLVEAPSRRTRRLWATCHGRPPGSRS